MIGSLVISDKTFSHVQEMASTESSTGAMTDGNCQRAKHQVTTFVFLSAFMIHEHAGLIRLGWRAELTMTLPQSHACRSPSVSEICSSAAALQLAQGLLFHKDIRHWSTCPANSLPIILIRLSTIKTRKRGGHSVPC